MDQKRRKHEGEGTEKKTGKIGIQEGQEERLKEGDEEKIKEKRKE